MKTSNFDKAKDTTRAADAARKNGNDPRDPRSSESTALVPVDEEAARMSVVARPQSDAEIAALFAGYDEAPQFITLREGDLIRGVFLRWGRNQLSDKPFTDRLTGEVKILPGKLVATVVMATEDGKREFLSAHELDRQLAPAVAGDLIAVYRGPDERVGDMVVTRYRTAIAKPEAKPAAAGAPS